MLCRDHHHVGPERHGCYPCEEEGGIKQVPNGSWLWAIDIGKRVEVDGGVGSILADMLVRSGVNIRLIDKDRIYEVFNMHHSVEKYLNLYKLYFCWFEIS